jgi:putative hemolysin
MEVQSDPRIVLACYPRTRSALPEVEIAGGRYLARFARDAADVEAIQRLRFEVFNLELREGLDASFLTGLDQDEFDPHCHHLMVVQRSDRAVVGTYRLQTSDMAAAGAGLYTAGEFDLSSMPAAVLDASVETGRACVAREHRNGRVLNLLWRGLATYLKHNHRRYIFGCCSLTSQDPHLARQTWDFLSAGSFVHPTIRVRPLPAFECYGPDFVPDPNVTVKLPPLFASYLKLKARIAGEPALDRAFKTIDFLTLIDVADLEPKTYRSFFDK